MATDAVPATLWSVGADAAQDAAVAGVFEVPWIGVPKVDAAPRPGADGTARPRVLKTGRLASAADVAAVANLADRLRGEGPLALVVEARFDGPDAADAGLVAALRSQLLPRASVVVARARDVQYLLGDARAVDEAPTCTPTAVPSLAARLRAAGTPAVCLVDGGAAAGPLALDWIDTAQARGWLALPRVADRPGAARARFAAHLAAAMARGFVAADAAVLAKMACAQARRDGMQAEAGFASDATLLPQMSWSDAPPAAMAVRRGKPHRALGLYAIVDSVARVRAVLGAGLRTVQLRIKSPPAPDAAWQAQLVAELRDAIAACRTAGAELFVNDHWQLAHEFGGGAVHLGQEDLFALGDAGRAALGASGLALGISSHSLWELCRARSLAPRYVACGPVWPTLTKAMPWHAQGLHNLAWWRHMAGAPVVAIGGILEAAQVREAAACGVDGVCVVRALGEVPAQQVPALQRAFDEGRACGASAPAWPRPSLD